MHFPEKWEGQKIDQRASPSSYPFFKLMRSPHVHEVAERDAVAAARLRRLGARRVKSEVMIAVVAIVPTSGRRSLSAAGRSITGGKSHDGLDVALIPGPATGHERDGGVGAARAAGDARLKDHLPQSKSHIKQHFPEVSIRLHIGALEFLIRHTPRRGPARGARSSSSRRC